MQIINNKYYYFCRDCKQDFTSDTLETICMFCKSENLSEFYEEEEEGLST
jgi:Zn finger protein HypA/HybF involved in hydrogenase expression